MNAAAVGLIGVIGGALLTGVVNLVLERRTRRSRAKVAAGLIAVELDVALAKMDAALAEDEWWLGDLRVDEWRTHQSDLASDASYEHMEELGRAHARRETCSA